MRLSIGDSVPDFTLKDKDGKDFNIRDLKGKRPFVVYFYPRDFTPGCTKEACSFRDRYEEFTELGAEVIGISSDSEKRHRKFSENYQLPFVLLSDRSNKVRKLFGVSNDLLGLLPGRETFVFDKEAKLIMLFNSMNAVRHIEKALHALKQLEQ
ncbi:redoxin domain-containing protein [Leptobacterium flavescens]|uniref:thioredoxin-dependent peroxiredoxin n=1 Tax=Leptobacterium flavescens TaxID=472055 RepID=A0A6P0UK96_9FLAO|nr:peroxiredoxin [Leptobacterium flavescens]NER12289.1 redoxin domain-containing protein [Leptobacterium flavescens]